MRASLTEQLLPDRSDSAGERLPVVIKAGELLPESVESPVNSGSDASEQPVFCIDNTADALSDSLAVCAMLMEGLKAAIAAYSMLGVDKRQGLSKVSLSGLSLFVGLYNWYVKFYLLQNVFGGRESFRMLFNMLFKPESRKQHSFFDIAGWLFSGLISAYSFAMILVDGFNPDSPSGFKYLAEGMVEADKRFNFLLYFVESGGVRWSFPAMTFSYNFLIALGTVKNVKLAMQFQWKMLASRESSSVEREIATAKGPVQIGAMEVKWWDKYLVVVNFFLMMLMGTASWSPGFLPLIAGGSRYMSTSNSTVSFIGAMNPVVGNEVMGYPITPFGVFCVFSYMNALTVAFPYFELRKFINYVVSGDFKKTDVFFFILVVAGLFSTAFPVVGQVVMAEGGTSEKILAAIASALLEVPAITPIADNVIQTVSTKLFCCARGEGPAADSQEGGRDRRHSTSVPVNEAVEDGGVATTALGASNAS